MTIIGALARLAIAGCAATFIVLLASIAIGLVLSNRDDGHRRQL